MRRFRLVPLEFETYKIFRAELYRVEGYRLSTVYLFQDVGFHRHNNHIICNGCNW